MPNTFAMAPGYVMRYVKTHHLEPPRVDPVSLMRSRTISLEDTLNLPLRGAGWRQDALGRARRLERHKARLIFSSPPYLEVIKYGKFNWIRLWLLGEDPKSVDRELLATASLTRYLDFMRRAIARMATQITPDGRVVLVVGDVRHGDSQIRLAEQVAESCVEGSGLSRVAILKDALPSQHKVSRIWGDNRGRATKVDRILILGGAHARKLPPLPAISWSQAVSVTPAGI